MSNRDKALLAILAGAAIAATYGIYRHNKKKKEAEERRKRNS